MIQLTSLAVVQLPSCLLVKLIWVNNCSDLTPLKTQDDKPLPRRLSFFDQTSCRRNQALISRPQLWLQLALYLMINITLYNPIKNQLTAHKKQNLTWFNCALHAQSTSTGKATRKDLLMNQEDKYRASKQEITSNKENLSHFLISLLSSLWTTLLSLSATSFIHLMLKSKLHRIWTRV